MGSSTSYRGWTEQKLLTRIVFCFMYPASVVLFLFILKILTKVVKNKLLEFHC